MIKVYINALLQEKDTNADEIKKLQAQIDSLGVAATEALELKEKVGAITAELKELKTENKTLTENYNSERVCSNACKMQLIFLSVHHIGQDRPS